MSAAKWTLVGILTAGIVAWASARGSATGPDAGTNRASADAGAAAEADHFQRLQLDEPPYLPEIARQFLRTRMERHGKQMMNLSFAVILLKHEEAASIAKEVADEPRISRPLADGEADLNAAFPQEFFRLQDELKVRAEQVAKQARAHNDKELAKAYGRMTETCVSCHSTYQKPKKTSGTKEP